MSVIVQATRFGPGLPAAGRTAQVQLWGEQLHIAQGGQTDIVPCAHCTATVGGFNHDQLQLQWIDALTQAQHALIPTNPTEQAALLAQLTALPERVMPSLARWRRSTTRQLRVWQTVLGSLAALASASARCGCAWARHGGQREYGRCRTAEPLTRRAVRLGLGGSLRCGC